MIITNLTGVAYSLGPMYLVPFGTLDLDDTSETSLYLLDDEVADAVNTLYQSGNIQVDSAADPFPRATGDPSSLSGDGSPEGVMYAPQGSLYMRRDSVEPVTSLYTKTTGVTDNTGWLGVSTPAPNGTCLIGTSWFMGQPNPYGDDSWPSAGVVMSDHQGISKGTVGGASLSQTGFLQPPCDSGDEDTSANIQFTIWYDDTFNDVVFGSATGLIHYTLQISAYSLDGANYLGAYCTDDPATDWAANQPNVLAGWYDSAGAPVLGSMFTISGGELSVALTAGVSIPFALNMALVLYLDND